MLLIGRAVRDICFSQSEALPRSSSGISTLVSQMLFRREISDGVANCRLFSEANFTFSVSDWRLIFLSASGLVNRVGFVGAGVA